jgi:hypothetical protein
MYPCLDPYWRRLRNFVNPHGLYEDRLESRGRRYECPRGWDDRRIGNWIGDMQRDLNRLSRINNWLDGISPQYRDRQVRFPGCERCYTRNGPAIEPYEPYDGYEAYRPYYY